MRVIILALLLAVTGVGSIASAQSDEPPMVGRETLVVRYQAGENLEPLFLDELAPETLLTVMASGFDPDTTGVIHQCVEGSSRQCRNRLPVRFDDLGAATLQYLVTNEIEPCRLAGERCTIELSTSGKVSVVETVFIDKAPPPGRLEVAPRHGLLVGDTVTVTARGFGPAAELTVMVCAVPSISGPRCGAPAPEVSLTIGRDGTGHAELVLDVSRVGSEGVACGRQVTCRVVVQSDQRGVRARAVALSFTASPGADYDTNRVILGLLGALGLAMVAAWLIASTDWRPPTESDATAMDEADYADLDLEAAQFDDRQTASWP